MNHEIENKALVKDLKQNFCEFSWLFLVMGILSFLSFLAAPLGTLLIHSARYMTSYLQWVNIVFFVCTLALIFVFALRHSHQLQFKMESVFFYLMGMLLAVVPILQGVILFFSGLLKKESVSLLTMDAVNAMKTMLLVIILCIVGLLFHNRSMAGLGIGLLVVYFVSLQVGDIVVFQHSLAQAGTLDANLQLTVNHFLMPIVNIVIYLILSAYARKRKLSK